MRRYVTGCDAVHPDRRGGQHVARPCFGVLALDETKGIGVMVSSERSQHGNKTRADELLDSLTGMDETPFRHCDTYIHDSSQPKCLRWFLTINRMPAVGMHLAFEQVGEPKLFADWQGRTVKVMSASRLGDVGISTNLQLANGYESRVPLSELSNFREAP